MLLRDLCEEGKVTLVQYHGRESVGGFRGTNQRVLITSGSACGKDENSTPSNMQYTTRNKISIGCADLNVLKATLLVGVTNLSLFEKI